MYIHTKQLVLNEKAVVPYRLHSRAKAMVAFTARKGKSSAQFEPTEPK